MCNNDWELLESADEIGNELVEISYSANINNRLLILKFFDKLQDEIYDFRKKESI
jgi:hypothetical protein